MALRITDGNAPNIGVLNRWADGVEAKQAALEKKVTQTQQAVVQVQATVGDASIPNDPGSFSIIESGYVVDGVLYSEVTAFYSAPNPLGTFAGVFLVAKGYRGSTELVKISEHTFLGAAGGSANFKTTLQRTNETVTFYLVSKNSNEASRSDWNNAPSTTALLDADAAANISGIQDSIIHVGTSPGAGNQFSYRQIATSSYAIVSGDILHFDVFIDSRSPQFQYSVDFAYAATQFRASGLVDQNALLAHPSTDLSSWANGRWYHRVFDLTPLAGNTISSWASAHEGDTAGAYTGRLANIRIVNGTTPKLAVFSAGALGATPIWSGGGDTYTGTLVYTSDLSSGAVNLTTHSVDGTTKFAQTASGLSYRPLSNPLTATDAGANATVSIAAFTQRTSSKGDISISSGSVTALSYNTLYYVSYDDASLAGGGVTFNAATTKETALTGSGRFYVGSILTPKAAAAATVGNNDGGVGAQAGGLFILYFGARNFLTVSGGAPTITNPGNMNDGDNTTSMNMQYTGTSSLNQEDVTDLGLSPQSLVGATSVLLKIKTQVTTNSLVGVSAGNAVLKYTLDGGGSYTTVYSLGNGATRALTTDSFTIPISQSLSLLQVVITVKTFAANTSGTLSVDFYEAWLEVQK